MSNPTETSPLLAHSTANEIEAPGAQIASPTGGNATSNGHTNGHKSNGTFPSSSTSATSDGALLERQTSIDEARRRQFEGDAEIKNKMKYILPAIGVGIWLAAADQTIIISSYGAIGSDLRELNKTSWIATSYFLTLTSFQPLYGKLSDIFGRKPMLLFAYFVFGLGCLWCGMARTMNELIVARALTGIGGGGMTTVVSILMSDLVPLKSRGVWQGIINIIFASGSGFGAPLGGVLADTIGWRWSFTGQAPLCLVAFISCYFVLQMPAGDTSHWSTKLKRIDFFGAFTLVTAVTLLLVGLDRGSNVAWDDIVAMITLALAGPFFLLFIFVEMRVSSEPFAPGHVIFERSLFAGFLCNFFSVGGWYAVLFYIPLYFQGVDGLSATAAGLRLVPAIICGVTGSLGGGLIMRWSGRYFWLNAGAYLLLTIAVFPLVMFTGLVSNSTVGILIALGMGGLGNGTGVTTSLIALISNAKAEDQAIATACSYLFRSLGSVLGLAVTSTMLQQQLRTKLRERLRLDGSELEEIVKRVRESLAYIRKLPPGTAEIVRNTYEESLRWCFTMVGAIVACALISSFFIREQRLGR